MARLTSLLLALFCTTILFAQQKDPSFEEMISLRRPGAVRISPDGKHVAFTVRTTDWGKNRYDSEIWLSKNGATPFQLTRTKDGSSGAPIWSPNGTWMAFTAKRGKHQQIFVIRTAGGEAFPITNVDRSINGMEWTPDGKHIIFRMQQPKPKTDEKREKRYGKYAVEDKEYKLTWLYRIPFDPAMPSPTEMPCYDKKDSSAQAWDCLEWPKPEALIDSVEYTITDFAVSPDGKYVAIEHQPDPLINTWFKSDISLMDLTSRELKPFQNSDRAEGLYTWSPDSKSILFSKTKEDVNSAYYQSSEYYSQAIAGGQTTRLGTNFDEELSQFAWTPEGIFAIANQRTERHLFKVNPMSGQVIRVALPEAQFFSYSVSDDGKSIAYTATTGKDLHELYFGSITATQTKAITNFTQQINGWDVAQSEVVNWKSEDGAEIEGILHKPQNFDPNKKYPLLVVIHGGPTGVDRPTPLPGYVYPIVNWLNKGALVLRVNYRGSAGYGEAFRALNVKNLGVGDAWDVLSGVDYLDQRGIIDTDKMGCMGWSQGGYISAFLTTTSNRFKAISVGAGISDWTTYYVNTDIHPFTRQYLKATPWEDPEVYAKTSPMTYINKASTPTLIQHGENDARVPIPNAYKLLQGLEDRDIPAKLVVYKGFGHGINKPKEALAAMWHNWQWFNKYLWEEEVDMPGLK